MVADGVAVDGGTPGGCRARGAGSGMLTHGQDAHVNTAAAANSGAAPGGAVRADGRMRPCPFGQFGYARRRLRDNERPRAIAPLYIERYRHRIDTMGYPFATTALRQRLDG
ncbi:hypothetical protein CJO66_34860 [Burkholderia ubonensis]|uniref:Uncharacterized protein n=2 Tax=Burkholderia ubonensis TaxID=101571 RepID=A0AB74D4T8_9BURK|nr:hypothetical protein CJO71_16610 [Burkholderia ubonensis]PAJ87594.1 hypothetical protein CJO70_10735 [Burkholderia ubonensis]PAJ90418.1 hypothetical protein CJO69_32745 [Burkholderia ubonensis]PAK00224.1 hypothetical protein CJO68_14990 [Burkholderia ubonensis]PAK07978.1 hypothetical protein CJO67_10075 [Burkholderia ubonensis]